MGQLCYPSGARCSFGHPSVAPSPSFGCSIIAVWVFAAWQARSPGFVRLWDIAPGASGRMHESGTGETSAGPASQLAVRDSESRELSSPPGGTMYRFRAPEFSASPRPSGRHPWLYTSHHRRCGARSPKYSSESICDFPGPRAALPPRPMTTSPYYVSPVSSINRLAESRITCVCTTTSFARTTVDPHRCHFPDRA